MANPTKVTPEKKRADNARRQREYRERHPDRIKVNLVVAARAMAKYRAAYPERVKNSQLKAKYGITLDEVNAMLVAQNGRCLICTTDISAKPYIDHCHTTGRVRGLLCLRCNGQLGWYESHVGAIVAYLTRT